MMWNVIKQPFWKVTCSTCDHLEKKLLHIINEFNLKMFIYIYIYICVHKEITCQLSWRSDKNLLKEKKKNLVSSSRNFEYLTILSRFFFSWVINQDSFHLELLEGENFFSFSVKKNLDWTSRLKRILADQPEKQESGKNVD